MSQSASISLYGMSRIAGIEGSGRKVGQDFQGVAIDDLRGHFPTFTLADCEKAAIFQIQTPGHVISFFFSLHFQSPILL